MAGKYLVGGVGGLVSYVAGNYYLDGSKPLHVQTDLQPRMEMAGVNILPVVAATFKALPESTRLKMMAKMNAPPATPPSDWFDNFGTDPYKVTEVVKGKVWTVQYTTDMFFYFDPNAKVGQKMLGMDFEDEKTAWGVMQSAERSGRQASAQARDDLEKNSELMRLIAEKGKTPETVGAAGPNPINMIVVKLNNGDIMLYCPTRVREETGFSEWLEGMGPVKWVVLGSSAHTLFIPSVYERYPSATYISSGDAWMKLNNVPNIKAVPDFDYTNRTQLDSLNSLLKDEGVQFHFIEGDTGTLALIPIAHRTALEVDIIYSLPDGGLFDYPKAKLEAGGESLAGLRLFKYALASAPTSPNDALPPYRFWMMDPASPMVPMLMTGPKKDGSSCTDMANSLRKVIEADFDQALGVHFKQMTGDEFRRSISLNWSWLDGKPLFEEKHQK